MVSRIVKLGAVAVIAILVVVFVLPLFASGDGWWQRDDSEEDQQTESARMRLTGVDPDGNIVILSDAAFMASITAGGVPLTEIRTQVEVKGSSPDFTEYRILSGSSLRVEAFTTLGPACPTCPVPVTITGIEIRIHDQTMSFPALQTLPFDDAWYSVADFTTPMAPIEQKARSAGAANGDDVRFVFTLTVIWDVVGDQGSVVTPDIVMRAHATLQLGADVATLVGAMTCEPGCR